MLPTVTMSAEGNNLLLLFMGCCLIFWFFRVCKFMFALYELRIAIGANQVVRIDGVGNMFGELELLSRQHFQQLLRSRQRVPPVTVNTVEVQATLDKESLQLSAGLEPGQLGIDFKFESKEPCTVVLHYGVPVDELETKRDAANGRSHRSTVASVPKKRKRRFPGMPRRYETVDNQTEMTSIAPAAGSLPAAADEVDVAAATAQRWCEPAGSAPAATASIIDTFSNRSEAEMFAAGADEPHVYRTSPSGMLAVTSLTPLILNSAREIQAREVVAAMSVAEQEGQELQVVPPSEPVSAEAEAPPAAATVPSSSAGNTTSTVYPLVVVISFDDAADATAKPDEPTPERVTHVLYGVHFPGTLSQPPQLTLGVPSIVKHLVFTTRACYDVQELYGMEEQTASRECVVCLSEPKDTILLPCRHLCVCGTCFHQLDKCPVCRAPFVAYLKFTNKKQEGAISVDSSGASTPECSAPATP